MVKTASKKNCIVFTLLLTAVIFLLTSCPDVNTDNVNGTGDSSSSSTSSSEGVEEYTSATERLEALGLTLETSPPVNGNGNEVAGTDNPFGDVISQFNTVYEFAQIGANVSGLGPYSVSEHSGTSGSGFSVLGDWSNNEAWMSFPKKSLAADIDGDGKENVITAVFNTNNNEIYLMIQDNSGNLSKHSLGIHDWVDDFGVRSWANDNFMMRDFTAGDFDGDELMEYAISCKDTILILEDDFSETATMLLPDKGDAGYPYVRVEAGDLNRDGYDDLVVVNGCIKQANENEPGDLHILAGGENGLGVSGTDADITNYAEHTDTLEGNATGRQYSSGEVAIFDYNGDGYNELALVGVSSSTGGSNDAFGWYCYYRIYLTLVDPYNETSGSFQSAEPIPDYLFGDINSDGGHHPRNFAVPRLVSGNFDAEERQMVNALDLILYVTESDEWAVFQNFVYTTSNRSNFNNMVFDTAVAGDITGDGIDELIYATYTNLPWNNYFYTGDQLRNTMSSLVIWGRDHTSATYGILDSISCSSRDEYPTLAMANVDDDTLVVEYLGHELVYLEPKILAVLASPPYDEDLGDDMDIGDSCTSYTIMNSSGDGSTVNWGFNVNLFVGVEVEDPSGSCGGEVEAAVNNSWDWSWGQIRTISETYTYTTNAGYDQVVFAGTPVDSYIYRVISYGQDMEDPGETITINIPRQPQTSSVERGFYNTIVGEDYAIPDSILVHTIGDPYSYYTAAEKAALETEADNLSETWMFSTDTLSVAQGSGTTEISTDSETTTTSTFDYDLGVEAHIKVKMGYVTGGFDFGAHVGYGYTYESSDGIGAAGAVGSIEDQTIWAENNFSWGLMMIPREFDTQQFNLVTYWVEEL